MQCGSSSLRARSGSPVTNGKLDLGPWQQIFYYEFAGRRMKRVILKALGT